MRPCKIENAIGEMAVLVFRDQRERTVARRGNAVHDVDDHRLVRLDRHPLANRDDRIEHRSLAVGQWIVVAQRDRCSGTAAAADEARSIGLERRVGVGDAMRDHQVEHRRRRLVGCARPSRAQDRAARADDLGLDEEVGERTMRRIGRGRREDDFGVARHLDRALRPAAIADVHPSELDVVFGRDDDLRMRVVFTAPDSVAPAELRA